MDTVIPGLSASAPEALPFDPSLAIRAFLLRRDRGNLLVYRAGTIEREAQSVNELGGLSRQYLNHRHEASPTCDWVAKTFGAPLHCHEAEAPAVSETCHVDETFSERHRLDDDFDVIPTPGHTGGATAYLWDTGRHRCLFTGDTIYFRDGEWVGALLGGVSDKGRYLEGADPHPRLRPDRALGRDRRPALPCLHRPGRRRATHRRDPRPAAPRRGPLTGASVAAAGTCGGHERGGRMSVFTAAERSYLAGRRLGRLATVGRDGTPHVVPSGWSYNEQHDTIDLGGADLDRTKKYRDVRRSGRAAIVIDDNPSVDPWRVRGVEIRGRAEALDRPEPLIRIHPERIVSWGIESEAMGERHARTVAPDPRGCFGASPSGEGLAGAGGPSTAGDDADVRGRPGDHEAGPGVDTRDTAGTP